jgi:chemotaxis protein methyltransferase CheR
MIKDEIDKLLTWAYTTYGLVLHDHQKKSFVLGFDNYLKKQSLDFNQCFSELSLGDSPIRQDMVDLLTIQESYFFRDQSLFVFLTHHMLPTLIKKKREENNKKINIWSAGCSHGQELYSLAILLDELIPDIQSWDVQLIGTDINHKALCHAERACYSKFALRATDDLRKNKYFNDNKGQFQLIPSIKNMAKFCYSNIAEPTTTYDSFDFIFCRNVFIYLDQAIIEQALVGFESKLNQAGVLFLGPSDFIHYRKHNFFLRIEQGVTYYDQINLYPSTCIVKDKPHDQSYLARQKQRIDAIQAVQELLEIKQFAQALDKINGLMTCFNTHSLLYRYKGEALIGLGELSTAKNALEMAIKKDVMDATSYVLLALVLMAEEPKKAEVALNKAIYLKQAFVEAHYHLAMLYLGQGLVQQGVRLLKKAKAAAEQQNKDTQVIGYDGNVGDLIDVIEGELEHYLGRL